MKRVAPRRRTKNKNIKTSSDMVSVPDPIVSMTTLEVLAARNLSLGINIIRLSKHSQFVIFSDSLCSMLAIHNINLETGYVLKK